MMMNMWTRLMVWDISVCVCVLSEWILIMPTVKRIECTVDYGGGGGGRWSCVSLFYFCYWGHGKL